MTITPLALALRGNQSVELSWIQEDGNFSAIQTAVNALIGESSGQMVAEGPFFSGTGFTPGTTTTLTLSQSYVAPQNLWVFFDAGYQGFDTYIISGATIVFNNPIPVGTSEVFIVGGTILPINAPAANSVGINQLQASVLNFFTQKSVLASSAGSSSIGYNQGSTGAATIMQQAKNQQTINVLDFTGIDPTGLTDSTTGVQAALNSLGTSGGTLEISNDTKILLNSNLTVPANVTIKGQYAFCGSPGRALTVPYGSFSALLVSSSATITLDSGSGIVGIYIFRSTMTFPAANSSAYAGTAITAAGDDIFVSKCMIVGFNQAINSTGYQSPRIEYVYHDNINGILVSNCADISYVTNCHAWPFGTIGYGAAAAKDQRSGIAYSFSSVGDDNKITNCFSWNYITGFNVNGTSSLTLLNCTADANASLPTTGQVGFNITGTSNDTRLIGCQASAQQYGYAIGTSTGQNYHTRMIGCDSWASGTAGVIVNSGDVSIIGGISRNNFNGIEINSTTSSVIIDDVRFAGNATSEIAFLVANSTAYIGKGNDFQSFASGVVPFVNPSNKTVPTIAASDPLLLPNNGDTFIISGTLSSGTLLSGWAGREVMLIFSTGGTLYDALTGPNTLKLNGNANFVPVANSAITLRHDGVHWFEVGRNA